MAGIFVRAVTTWAPTPTAATSARTVTGSVTALPSRGSEPASLHPPPLAGRRPLEGHPSWDRSAELPPDEGDSGAKCVVVGVEGPPRLEPYPGVVYRWRRTIVVILLVALFALVLVDVIASLAG